MTCHAGVHGPSLVTHLLLQWFLGLSISKGDGAIKIDLTDPIQRFVSVVYQVTMCFMFQIP